jgi:hypothetical protein
VGGKAPSQRPRQSPNVANWKRKVRVSLRKYFKHSCIRAGQGSTGTIEVYDKNGTLLDSINVTLGPKCDCPGGQ